MDVDEARADVQVRGVDDPEGSSGQSRTDCRDAPVFHGDVGDVPGIAPAVEHAPPGQDEIEVVTALHQHSRRYRDDQGKNGGSVGHRA
jgi:hypothetical protein